MEIELQTFTPAEQAMLRLRALYERAGYRKYRCSHFEEYALYQQYQRFLPDAQVVTFTDLDGKLRAIKPDVTLSIAKTAQPAPGECKRFYYNEEVCRMILEEFGLDPDNGHIINGHTPIKVREGESPLRGNGKLFVIDGGLCQAYHSTTGIAGYTLIFSSHGMVLKAHRPFESTEKAISEHIDIKSDAMEVEHYDVRLKVANSDNGEKIKRAIFDLEALLHAYQSGTIIEKA